MKTSFMIIVCITLFLDCFFSSCKKSSEPSDNCITYQQSPVAEVTGPKTGSINKDINFTVSFGCSSGCAKYGTCSQTVDGNTRTIMVITRYEGCICTMIAPILQTTYTFKTAQAGTYFLKFLQSNNYYLTDTLVVQ